MGILLQGGLDIWAQLFSVAGLVSTLLAIATVTLWLEVKSKDRALQLLNEQVKKDAKESMQIVTSVEVLLDRMISAQADGEKRILASVAAEAGHIKDLIHAYKEHNNQKGENG